MRRKVERLTWWVGGGEGDCFLGRRNN